MSDGSKRWKQIFYCNLGYRWSSFEAMTLEKVKLEIRDTPKQIVESSVITTDNSQTAEQCSSNTAPLTHALLIDEFDVANENGSYYLLANKKCFQATMYSTEPGALEHNKELLDSEETFRIDEVLDDDWEGFGEDLHCEGSFLTWEMDQTLLQEKGKTDGASKKQLTKKTFELKIMPKHLVIINSVDTLLYCLHKKISEI